MLAAAEPVRLHPRNPHYFLFRGKTVALVTTGEHYGSVLNGDFDFRRYLETLSAAHMNYTRIFGGSYVEMPGKSFGIQRNNLAPAPGRFVAPWSRSETPGYAGGGNTFDLDRWNPDYFERLETFLAEASKRDIVVELTLFSSTYGDLQWQVNPFNPANNVNGTDAIEWKKLNTLENGNILGRQEQYVRKLVREVNKFDNVMFEIQNEPWSDRTVLVDTVNPYLQKAARDVYPNSIDLADDLSIAWQTRVASWITNEEANLPQKHLIAQNYCNFRFPVQSLVPGASIVNFHYAYPEAATLNHSLGKALVYDETGFIGRDDAVYRRQAWTFMMSGGSGFNHLDYSFTVGREDGTDTAPNGPGGGSPALRAQLGLLSAFLHSLPLADLEPDSSVVKHVGGAYAHALSQQGRVYAIYLDGNGPSEVTLSLPAGYYSGQWMNVATGAVERTEGFRHGGGKKVLTSPDFANGIALRLNAETRPKR